MELTERRKLEGFPRYCAAEQLLAASRVVVHPYRIIVRSGQPECQATHVALVSMLENEAMPLTMPRQPSYFVGRRHEAEEAREGSVNSAGLTTLVGR